MSMRYSGLILNDIAAAPGVCVTLFTQGCPHKCDGCHNPETWDFDAGLEFSSETLDQIIDGLYANGIERNFCLMGGEPLCDENIFLSYLVIKEIKQRYPNIKIYIWTGYLFQELQEKRNYNPKLNEILNLSDVLIDGPYIKEQRDITLALRGSRNQNIILLDNFKKI